MSQFKQVSSTQDLVICLDFADPHSYLALTGSLALVKYLNLSVQWLPLSAGLSRLSSRQPMALQQDPLAEYKARRAQARQKNTEAELRRTSRLLDIPLANFRLPFDAAIAAIGLLFVNGVQADASGYIEAVFETVFRRGITSNMLVTKILSGLDVDLEDWQHFVQGPGPEALQQLEDELLSLGVFSSPGYIHRGECYHGRQHLPLLRWYLSGAKGAAPV